MNYCYLNVARAVCEKQNVGMNLRGLFSKTKQMLSSEVRKIHNLHFFKKIKCRKFQTSKRGFVNQVLGK